MQTQRMSLASIKNVLSRAEMRKIMAGSGPSCGLPACICVDDPCCYPAPGEGGCPVGPGCCSGHYCWPDDEGSGGLCQ